MKDMYHRPEVFGHGILHQINPLGSLNRSENEISARNFHLQEKLTFRSVKIGFKGIQMDPNGKS